MTCHKTGTLMSAMLFENIRNRKLRPFLVVISLLWVALDNPQKGKICPCYLLYLPFQVAI